MLTINIDMADLQPENLDHRNALPNGTWLDGYEIQRLLGHGGFGITYCALDSMLKKTVAIKEYLPQDYAVRVDKQGVMAKSRKDEAVYDYGLARFIDEAKHILALDHPNIVKVLRLFRANNTAYMVMEYREGETLQHYLKRQPGGLDESSLRAIFNFILDGLAAVHAEGLLHRDIKPSNIYLRSDFTPMLIDFGAARYSLSERTESFTVALTPGYAPLEQYGKQGKQGHWTDLYGLAASMYVCMTGGPPEEATDRSVAMIDGLADPYVPVAKKALQSYSRPLTDGVDMALALRADKRPKTVDDFRNLIETIPISNGARIWKRGIQLLLVILLAVSLMRLYSEEGDRKLGKSPGGSQELNTETRSRVPTLLVPKPAVTEDQRAEFKQLPETGHQEKINKLLNKADDHLKKDELTQPPSNNAYEIYRNVLRLDPGNHQALEGMEHIKRRYLQLIKSDIKKYKFVDAEKKIVKIEIIDDDYPGLREAKDDIQAAKSRDGEIQASKKHKRDCVRLTRGKPSNPPRAIDACRKAVASNPENTKIQERLGRAYAEANQYAEAIRLLRKPAEQGSVAAQLNLGLLYSSNSVQKNFYNAVKWFQKAAEQGNAQAQYNLGVMYERGDGVEKNPSEAVFWFEEAARQGHKGAQYSLQRWYR